MVSAQQIRHLLVASDITISPYLSHRTFLSDAQPFFQLIIDQRQNVLGMIIEPHFPTRSFFPQLIDLT